MHLPIGLFQVERQLPEPLADDTFVVGRGISGRGARMRNEPVVLVQLPGPVRRQRKQAAVARLVLAQRLLRIVQQEGFAGRRVHHGVNLARFDGPQLRGALDQPQDAALEPQPGTRARRLPVETGSQLIHSFTPSARSTLLFSPRLPTIFAAGNGDNLARLGVTRMPSAKARSGCSSTSIISSLNLSSRYSLQIAARLATARTEFGALFAMYRRITTTFATAGPDLAPFFFFLRGTAGFLPGLLSGFSRTVSGATLREGGCCPGCRASCRVRAADPAHLLLPVARGHTARFIVTGVRGQYNPLPLEILLQGLDPGLGVRFGNLQFRALVIELGAK